MKKISLVLLTFLLMLVTACEMPQTQTKTKLVAPQISLRENVIKKKANKLIKNLKLDKKKKKLRKMKKRLRK